MKKIDVCLTPELLKLYDLSGTIVVAVDILRATSCMVTAFAHGIKEIIPVKTLEECEVLREEGFLAAAERNGEKVDGYDFGNSPFSYMDENIKGKTLAVTTTNGTIAITESKSADEVLIGAFLNLQSVSDYLIKANKDIIIVCAGWKGRVNLEDTLFAGALIDSLKNDYSIEHDAAILALSAYEDAADDIISYLSTCSHVRRLQRLNISKDIEFCLRRNVYNVVPMLKGNSLVLA